MNCIIDLFLMSLSKYSNLVVKYQWAGDRVEIENFVKDVALQVLRTLTKWL